MRLFFGWAVSLTIFNLISCHLNNGAIAKVKNKTIIHRGIHKRGLFYPVLLYPYNACSGILVAIAIPLNLKNRNAFVSYNFEANYNMPNQPGDSFPGAISRFPGLNPPSTDVDPLADGSPDDFIVQRSFDKSKENETSTEVPEKTSVQKREADESIIFTRKGVYRLLESRLNA